MDSNLRKTWIFKEWYQMCQTHLASSPTSLYICLTWNSTLFPRLGYKLYPRPPIQSIPSTQFSSLIWTQGTGSSSKWHLGPLGGISPASCSRRSHSPAGSSNKMPASTPQWPWDSCAPLVGGCALFIVFFPFKAHYECWQKFVLCVSY